MGEEENMRLDSSCVAELKAAKIAEVVGTGLYSNIDRRGLLNHLFPTFFGFALGSVFASLGLGFGHFFFLWAFTALSHRNAELRKTQMSAKLEA